MVLGAILTSVFALGGKWRDTATGQRAVTGTAFPEPALPDAASARPRISVQALGEKRTVAVRFVDSDDSAQVTYRYTAAPTGWTSAA
jgi:hypothetical protein